MAPRRLRRRKAGNKQKNKPLVGWDVFECRTEGCLNWVTAPSDTKSILCWRCTAAKQPAPKERSTTNPAKRALKRARRKASSAKEMSDIPKGLPRGWHRRKFFKIKIDDKWFYFVQGESVKRAEFFSEKRKQDSAKEKSAPHKGYGRGWHLKKRFEAPDGKVYEYGEEVK